MYLSLLKNTNFLKIWVAQLASQLAANLLNFALIIRIFELAAHTKYANIAVSLLILAFAIPSIIFAVVAGAYVDHLDRKKVLVITNIARAILIVFFLVFESNLMIVYLLVFAISIFSQFFTPAEGAALPRLVKKEQFIAANSLFLFTLYSSFVIGYSLAGPIIGTWGSSSIYWVTIVAFVFAAILSFGLPTMRPEAKGLNFAKINEEVFATIRQSTVKIFKTPQLIFPILNLTIGQVMIGVIAVLAPALAIVIFNQSLTTVSTKLIVPAAMGMVVGAILVGQFFKRINKIKLINAGIVLVVVGLLSMSFVPQLQALPKFGLIVIFVSLILGLGNALVSVSAQTLLQLNSTDEERGKIFGTLNMMMNIAASVPVLLAGITADLVSPLTVLTGAGVLIAIYGVYQWVAFRKVQLKNS